MLKYIGILLSLASATITPVNAGLGPAENIRAEFEAWCGQEDIDCKVDFGDGLITVDGQHTITRAQLQKYETTDDFICLKATSGLASLAKPKCTGKGTALLFFEENGKEGVGAIMFVHRDTYIDFKNALTVFCGGTCRPLGPSLGIR